MAELRWLGYVRHGESTGNLAAARAEADGLEVIDIPERDADVPLSDTGREQAAAVGRRFATDPPDLVVCSPYLRTVQTAELAVGDTGVRIVRDERLRDRELGILDLLTYKGVRVRHPDEAERRKRLGPFYYRPPGGESWADVTLRLRGALGDLRRDYADQRVLVVAHEVSVYLLRYLLEHLTEQDMMKLVKPGLVANCSITTWRRDDEGLLAVDEFCDTGHLRQETTEAGVHSEPV
jgi:2,3-bisphosphoglycerate-dependent phosphoglycerate mutase